MKPRQPSAWLGLALALGFAFGLLQLIRLRFETGDVYPPYSSLRTDPLGTSALYESLDKIPALATSRDFRPTDQLPEGRDITYLHLGANWQDWRRIPAPTAEAIEKFVKAGGRLVVTLQPGEAPELEEEPKPESARPPVPAKKGEPGKPRSRKSRPSRAADPADQFVSVPERWGLGLAMKALPAGTPDQPAAALAENPGVPGLPKSLPWHSAIVITNPAPAWRVIYARDGDPVLVERRWGRGTLVLATDTYQLSNEALRRGRETELLAWVIGPGRQVVFDEAHLGIVQITGVASLMRQYRLQWLAAGLLGLAGLFIWKNAAGFGPRRQPVAEGRVTGKDAATGFVNLLRRHIGPREILPTCVAEWGKALPPGPMGQARRERVDTALRDSAAQGPAGRDPVQLYQTICGLIKPGNAARPAEPPTAVPPIIT